jgi:hypothetical protein
MGIPLTDRHESVRYTAEGTIESWRLHECAIFVLESCLLLELTHFSTIGAPEDALTIEIQHWVYVLRSKRLLLSRHVLTITHDLHLAHLYGATGVGPVLLRRRKRNIRAH